MFDQFAILFGNRVPMYTVSLVTATFISLLWMIFSAPASERTKVLDVCLAALLGAILIGRTVHVGIHWQFFSDNQALIWQIQHEGGFNWHSALLAALMVGSILARIRGLKMIPLINRATVIVPLFALTGWYACATAGCAYGAEIERMSDFPQYLTWIAPDIYRLEMPRFATQPIAMTFSMVVLGIAVIFALGEWLQGKSFWLMVLLVSLITFSIGFLRGDSIQMVGIFRGDQVLDIAMIVIAIIGIVGTPKPMPQEIFV